MPEIRMPVGGGTPTRPSTNEVSLYVKTDKRFYMQDDQGTEVKLLTDEATLAGLNVQEPLTSTGGSNPTLSVSPVTITTNGVMRYQDKIKLDNATNLSAANSIVMRDAQSNFAANEITANLFKGTASSVATIPALSGVIASDGTSNNTSFNSGVISNVHISSSAAISISKLEVNPLNRANHTGVQDASTLSNFGVVVDEHLNNQAPIINDMISATAGISLSKLETNPLERANHTGTQLSTSISDFEVEVNNLISEYYVDNLITNDNISDTAAIAISKLETDPLDRTNHIGTQEVTTITGLPLGVFNTLEEGPGVNFNYDNNKTTIEVVGTSGRITSTIDGIDIDTSYRGQVSIDTLGTITSGTWNGSVVSVPYGGTGATNPGEARNNLLSVETIDESTTISTINNIILVDATNGNLVVDLPPASQVAKFVIKKIDSTSNTITVNVEPGDDVEGATNFVLTTQYEYKIVASNENTSWFYVG